MIFVDSNVFIYAVGRSHPFRDPAQDFFVNARRTRERLVTSAEVLQELLHVYLPVQRMEALDAALDLAVRGMDEIVPVTADAVQHARQLADEHPALTARDLIHLAVCHIHKIVEIKTFDRKLQSAFERRA